MAKLDAYVPIKINSKIKDKIKKIADEKGMNVGSYIRYVLMKEIEKEE